MMEKVHSNVTGKDYYIKDVVRILNLRQICTFLKIGILPVDIYPSVDFKTGNPVLVAIFNKSETQDAYQRWKESDNLWEELQNE